MQGMPGGMQQLERACSQSEPLAVGGHAHALGRDRHQLAVELRKALRAVDAPGAGDQLLGIDHVRRAARMQYGTGVGERPHQCAGAASVIQVHVGQQQVVDRLGRDAELGERGEQVRHREVSADIDERGATGILDDVCGGVTAVQVLGVDRGDAVRVAMEIGLHRNVDACRMARATHVHIVTKYASLST